MKKILILNLARLGDLIQTAPLMEGLKKKYPDSHLTILTNVKFHQVCRHIPVIDEVIPFDVAQFGKKGTEEISILPIYRYLDRLARELEERRFDLLVNLGHSKLSAVFSSLLDIPDVRGFVATKMGNRVVKDPWLGYFSGILHYRKFNRLNLVDLYTMSGGTQSTGAPFSIRLSPDAVHKTKKLLSEFGVGEGELLAGIQAGSSREDRRWSPEKFARVADTLARKKGARVILFGVPSETELGKKIEGAMESGCLNLIGKTSLDEMIGLVAHCRVLVTNDTGTMHVAAACGTPTVALFLAHAWVHETGPYGDNHVVLEADISCAPCNHRTHCSHTACMDYVTVQDVCDAVSLVLGTPEEKDRILKDSARFPRSLAFRSGFDDLNLMDYFPIRKRPVGKEELYSLIYKRLWVHFFDPSRNAGIPGDPHGHAERAGESVQGVLETYYTGSAPEEVARSILTDSESWDLLEAVARRGIGYCDRLDSLLVDSARNIQEIKSLGVKITSLGVEIETIGLTNPSVSPITQIYLFRSTNLEDEELSVLASKFRRLFEDLSDQTGFLRGAVNRVLNAAQSKSIPQTAGFTD